MLMSIKKQLKRGNSMQKTIVKNTIQNIISSVKDFFKRLLSSLRNFFFGQKEESVITVETVEPTTRKSPESVQKGRGGKEGFTFSLTEEQKCNHGYIWSEEQREYYKLTQTGVPHKNYGREVIQYDKDTCEEINRFKNISEASKKTNICYNSIFYSCNLKAATAGGFIWMYA